MNEAAELCEILLRMLLEAPVEGGKAIMILRGSPFDILRGRHYIDHIDHGKDIPVTWFVTQKGLDFIKGE